MLLASFAVMFAPTSNITAGPAIDGNFDDWIDVPLRSEYVPAIHDMNMVSYASMLSAHGLFMYLKVRGPLFSGDGSRIYAFVDADNNTNSGYRINGIGADYLCKVYGNSTEIVHGAYVYTGSDSGLEWNWSSASSLPVAYNGNQLEMSMYSGGDIQNNYRIAFYTSDSHGNYAISSANIGANPSLYFEAKRCSEARDIYDFDMGQVPLMDINVFATGGNVSLTSINMATNNLNDLTLRDSSGSVVSQFSGGQMPVDVLIGDKEHRSYQIWGTVPASGINGTLISINGIGVREAADAIVHTDAEAFKAYVGNPASIKIDGAFGDWTNVKDDPLNETVPQNIDIRQYNSYDDRNNLYFYVGVEKGMMAGVLVPEKYSEGKPSNNASTNPIKPPETGEDILRVHILTDDNKEYTIQVLGKNGDIVSYSVSGPGISGGVNVAKDFKRLEGSVSMEAFGGSSIESIWFEISDWSKQEQRTETIQPEQIMVSEEGTRAATGPFISCVRESNETSKAIVITWVTDVNTTGQVRYSLNPDLSSSSVEYDIRGSNYETTLHYVKIINLNPETTYYYEVLSSTSQKTAIDDNGGNYYNFTTLHLLDSSSPQDTIWGHVYKSDGTTPAEGAIVYVNVTTAGGDTSYPLAAPVASDAIWFVDMSNFVSRNSGDQVIVQNGDSLHIEVEGGLMGTAIMDTTVDGTDPQDCGDMILGNLPVSGAVSFATASGNAVSSYILGDNVYVRVVDNDSATNDPSQIDIISATVSDPVTDDSESIILEETGLNTGIFTNTSHPLISMNSSSSKNDGIISTEPGNYIYISYVDSLDGDNNTSNNEKTSQALIIGYKDQSIHFVDDNGTEVEKYHIGDNIYILLASSNDTMPKITNIRESNETSKAIVITWVTDVNTTGQVRYSLNPDLSSSSVEYDIRGSNYETTLHYVKIINLNPETTYYYEVLSSTSQKTAIDDNGGNYYNFTTLHLLDSSSPQDTIWGHVYKSDGTTPAEGAIVYVNVTTAGGDTSYPLAAPVASDAIWFVDMSNFVSRNSGDQVIVQNGDSLHIEVEGGLMGTAIMDTTVDGTDPQDCGDISLGEPYHISPPTPGRNQDPNVAENVTVSLEDSLTGDFESVVLNETGPNTSVSMNTWDSIGSSSGLVNTNDSIIETADNHLISVKYYGLNDTAIMLDESKGIVSFTDSGENAVDQYVIGDDLYVRVVDSNANLDSNAPDALWVNLSNPSRGDYENVSLSETGNDTGIFMNSLDVIHSSKNTSSPNDGSLEAQNGDVINVTYADNNPAGYLSYDSATMISAALQITKIANTTTVSPNEEFYYTIRVDNTGSDAALNVEIVDVLPDNITYLNDTANADEISHDGQRNTWIYHVLNPGDYIEFRIYVRVANNPGNGTIVNNATLNYTDSHDREQPSMYATAITQIPEFEHLVIPLIFTLIIIAIIRNRNKRQIKGV